MSAKQISLWRVAQQDNKGDWAAGLSPSSSLAWTYSYGNLWFQEADQAQAQKLALCYFHLSLLVSKSKN